MKGKMRVLVFVMVTALILATGCGKTKEEVKTSKQAEEVEVDPVEISLTLDDDGNYTGLDSISEDYAKDQAVKDGCYVWVDYDVYGGQDIWDQFVKDTKAGTESGIRIATYMGDELYLTDVIYTDETYHMFVSSDEEKLDNKTYGCLLELSGSMPNTNSDTKFAVLTDDEELSFDDVMSTMLASDEAEEDNSVSPYLMIWMN